jgi:hypothetical protein
MDAALDHAAGIGGAAAVSPARMAALEGHLAACPACRRQWNALQTAEAVLRVPRPVAAPEGMLAELRGRLEAEAAASRTAPRVSRSMWSWLWPAGSLAAAGAAAALVMAVGVRIPESPQQVHERVESPVAEPDSMRAVGAAGATAGMSRAKPPIAKAPPREAPRTARGPVKNGPVAAASGAAEAKPAPSAKGRVSNFALAQEAGPALNLDLATAQSARGKTNSTFGGFGGGATSNTPPPSTGDARYRKSDKMARDYSAPEVRPEALGLEQGLAREPEVVRNESRLARFNYQQQTPTLLAATDFVQVSVEPLPPELNVSAAVLNALQRDVTVEAAETSVGELAKQLAEAADVVLKVDARVALTNVTVQESGAPLWRVLEDAARQGGFEIHPRENTLVLSGMRPLAVGSLPAPAAKKPAAGKSIASSPAAKPSVRQSTARAQQPRPTAAAPITLRLGLRGPAPDRHVWPSAWGSLPERGFAVPSAAELPALALSLEVSSSQEIPRIRGRAAEPSGGAAPAVAPEPPKAK